MNELKVTEVTEGEIIWNYETLKNSLTKSLKRYKDLIVTEENLKESKSDQRELSSLRTALNKKRISVKKDLQKPINVFDEKCKELVSLIVEAETPIQVGLDSFEEKRKAEMREKIQESIDTIQEAENLPEKYLSQVTIKPNYLLKTAKWKNIESDLLDVFKMLSLEWEKEKSDIETIKTICKTASSGIESVITPDNYIERYKSGRSLSDMSEEIMREADNRKEAENAVAKKAVKDAEEKKTVFTEASEPGRAMSMDETVDLFNPPEKEEDEVPGVEVKEFTYSLRITCSLEKKDRFKAFLDQNSIGWEQIVN